jgi:hypothetical protein
MYIPGMALYEILRLLVTDVGVAVDAAWPTAPVPAMVEWVWPVEAMDGAGEGLQETQTTGTLEG